MCVCVCVGGDKRMTRFATEQRREGQIERCRGRQRDSKRGGEERRGETRETFFLSLGAKSRAAKLMVIGSSMG